MKVIRSTQKDNAYPCDFTLTRSVELYYLISLPSRTYATEENKTIYIIIETSIIRLNEAIISPDSWSLEKRFC